MSTDGPNWQPINWGPTLPLNFSVACCSPPLGGYVCDADTGRVISLNLNTNQLSGPLPASLGNLSELQSLLLYFNSLNGSIPDSLGGLLQLQYLYLDFNQLTGPIPASLGNLSRLLHLVLSVNQLTGSIPDSVGSLSRLQFLWMASNQLTGPIPDSFGSLLSLQKLLLYSNQLNGSIPASLGSLSQLQTLALYSNQLDGSIPESLGSMPLLELLFMNDNHLSGQLSCASLGPHLQTLDLQRNALVGPIPSCFCNQVQLTFVYLGNNNFTSFPNCSLPVLFHMDLSSNLISSFPFSMIPGFSSLMSLDLSFNALSGAFPLDVFITASSLRSLSLAYNQYKDVFPVYACNFRPAMDPPVTVRTNLETLDLSGNEITGIPGVVDYNNSECNFCSTSAYYSLTSLHMKDTKLPPLFPSFDAVTRGNASCSTPPLSFFDVLQFLTGLVSLDVSANNLSVGLDVVLSLPLLSSFDILDNSKARKSLLSYTNQQRFSFDPSTSYPLSTNMSCVQAAVGRLSFQADPAFFDYKNCVCRPGFFGKPPTCSPCLSNADCSFRSEANIPFGNISLAFRESGNVIAQIGYYASPSVTFAEMMNNESYPKAMEVCSHAGTDLTACDARQTGPCKAGYKGRLCSACSSGFFRTGDRCIECPQAAGLVLFAIFVVLAAVGLVLWSFFVGSSSSGLVKMLLFFWQALYFIRTPMSNGLYSVTHGTSSMIILSLAGPECFFRNWDYTSNYVLSVTAPLISVVLVVLVWRVGQFRFRTSAHRFRRAWSDRCRRSCIFLFLLLFMSAVSAILASLSCTTDAGDGKSYLVFYPNEECSSILQAVSSILLVFYVLVIPGGLSFVIWRSGVLSKNAKPHTRRMHVYSLLFGSYRPNRRWWEIVVTIRRVLFVVAYVTIPPLSEYRTMLVAIVLVAAAGAQAIATPYHRGVENPVEIISLGILLVNLVCFVQSQVLAVQGVDGAGAFVFAMNVSFSVVLIGMLLSHVRRHWRTSTKPGDPLETLAEGLLMEENEDF
eukprot:ANDGO_00366.mRNA.1 Putative leucine-rich repeat-containing protein DDB_G0281931